MIRTSLILGILLLWLASLKSQNDNNVYLTVGTLVFLQSVNINYEIRLNTWKPENKLYLKAQFGWAGAVKGSDEGPGLTHNIVPSLGITYLWNIGKNKNVDFGVGGLMILREDVERGLPYISIGYRRQTKNQIFRVGFGLPEGVYFSYGFRF